MVKQREFCTKQKIFVFVAMVIMAAFIACDNGTTTELPADPDPDPEPTGVRYLIFENEQVWWFSEDYPHWRYYDGENMDVECWNIDVSGSVTGGLFTLRITPANIAAIDEDNIWPLPNALALPWDDAPANVQAVGAIRFFPGAELFMEKGFNVYTVAEDEETRSVSHNRVSFIHVDQAISFTFPGITTDEEIWSDFEVNLEEGWNAVHWQIEREDTWVVAPSFGEFWVPGMPTRTLYQVVSPDELPDNLRWFFVEEEEDEWEGPPLLPIF